MLQRLFLMSNVQSQNYKYPLDSYDMLNRNMEFYFSSKTTKATASARYLPSKSCLKKLEGQKTLILPWNEN